jgi:acetyl-CoA carboxylase biotin carboxyl carrier protein
MPGKNQARKGGSSERSWNLHEIRELIDVLIEREVSEFEMERDGLRIRVKRGNAGTDIQSSLPSLAASSPPVWNAAPPAPAVGEVQEQPPPAESAEELHVIKSPIVGTFYSAPAPNAPPFVKLGDVVQVGQVLCIVEAMKLMNEIESEVAGEVVRIYVEEGQPVEYGQSLFAIKPSHKK